MPPQLIQFCTDMDNPEFNAMDFDAPGSIPKITWIMGQKKNSDAAASEPPKSNAEYHIV